MLKTGNPTDNYWKKYYEEIFLAPVGNAGSHCISK